MRSEEKVRIFDLAQEEAFWLAWRTLFRKYGHRFTGEFDLPGLEQLHDSQTK